MRTVWKSLKVIPPSFLGPTPPSRNPHISMGDGLNNASLLLRMLAAREERLMDGKIAVYCFRAWGGVGPSIGFFFVCRVQIRG